MGGQALTDAIFGVYNPSGRLTISIPYHVGQQPIFYNVTRGCHQDKYADMAFDPCWAFGYGLSYSNIIYESAKLNKEKFNNDDKEVLECSVTLKNDSDRDAIEVVQIYINDVITSCTWTVEELKGYERVVLKAQETKTVTIKVPISECSIVDANLERVVEAGEFECRVGRSSNDFPFVLKFEVLWTSN